MKGSMQIFRSFPGLLHLWYMLFTLLLIGCGFTRGFIYYPPDGDPRLPVVGQGSLVSITNGNRTVYGHLARNGPSLVVLFHGNGSSIYHEARSARAFYRAGFSTLLVEYPGYGFARDQEPSEEAIVSDTRAMVHHVQSTMGFSREQTTIRGHSLGTGVAVASHDFACALILVSPYTSIPAVASDTVVPLLPYLLVADTFDSLELAPAVSASVLILHGQDDQTIPFWMGAELAEAFPDATLVPIARQGHNLRLSDDHWAMILSIARGCQ